VDLDDCPVSSLQDFLRSVHYARYDAERFVRRPVKVTFRRNVDSQLVKPTANIECTPPQFNFSMGYLELGPTYEILPSIFVLGAPWKAIVRRKDDGEGLKITINGTKTGFVRRGNELLHEREKIAEVITGKDELNVFGVKFMSTEGTVSPALVQKVIRSLVIPFTNRIRKHTFVVTFAATEFADYSQTVDVYAPEKELRR